MQIQPMQVDNLACPIDDQALVLHDRQLRCVNNHCFDLARQGYVNLLPVQHKRSKHPGDSKVMVAARQRFLNTGVYSRVAETLSSILLEAFKNRAASADPGTRPPSCLDAGCGEGYYLDYVLNYLRTKRDTNALGFNPGFIGLDISKEAIVAAAKRNKGITWIVGTNRHPPIVPGSVDIIFCIFGFHSFQGFYNVLPVGGKLLLAEPGPDHLQELRQVTYPQINKTAPKKLDDAFAIGFRQVDEQILHFNTPALPNKSLKDLLLMTPHFFRATQEGREAAAKLDDVSLTVDITFRSLEKTKS